MGFPNFIDGEVMEDCTGINMMGLEYKEISCVYSWLEPFYLRMEQYYDPIPFGRTMYFNSWFPLATCALYVALVFAGRKYFESRPRWNWRYTMAGWNLFLSVFSTLGFLRVLPVVVYQLRNYTVTQNFCADPQITFGNGSSGLWVQLFVLSKFPELLDTFFIVIHKKPLIFLHWYHHVTVLLYSWYCYVCTNPIGLYFTLMNFGVHSVMYFYYFLMTMKMKPKWFNPKVITVAQLVQMFVGVSLTLAGFWFSQNVKNCFIRAENNTAACIMYGSYFCLFLQFFIERYVLKKDVKIKAF